MNSKVNINKSGNIEIICSDSKVIEFTMDFNILYSQLKPEYKKMKLSEAEYNVHAWKISQDQYSKDYFKSGELLKIKPEKHEKTSDNVKWYFPKHELFSLIVELTDITELGEPLLEYTFTPKAEGWFSIGYSGAQRVKAESIEAIFQPLIWQGKCLPVESYITPEYHCTIASPLVSYNGVTIGVAAAPDELPYRMPTFHNNRFGILIRNQFGEAQPMIFAPLLGGDESYMKPDGKYKFSFYIVARNGNWLDTFEYIARNIYGFKDRRENSFCTLNDTINNVIEYAKNDYYSKWNADLKGCSYDTDVPGAVKNVSATQIFGVAAVTDDEEIIHKRALPMLEYYLSREKAIFTTNEKVIGQGASRSLDGPCIPLSELASLSRMFFGKMPIFRHYAEKMYNGQYSCAVWCSVKNDGIWVGKSWLNALSMYRLTGNRMYLEEASDLADEYIKENIDVEASCINPYGFFWPSYVPDWAGLTELYEETKEKKYLDAAVKSARKFCAFIWYSPPIPDGNIVVNEGGRATIYAHTRGKETMKVPEECVPAWRVSEIGLTCESSPTCHGHRAIFMAFHAPYMLRLALYSGDVFLQHTARSAIVGRSENFPGYHMNTKRTTVYEKLDYPYHEFSELSYNSFHFNHIWPFASMLIDYLISDVFNKSEGNIFFPSEFAECFAYMKGKMYGFKPGKFYDEDNVWLWMPKDILKTGNVQVNYITARSDGRLYAAFVNQSFHPIDTNVYVNDSIVGFSKNKRYIVKVWEQNKYTRQIEMKGGVIPIHIETEGITAIAIENIRCEPNLQKLMNNPLNMILSDNSFIELSTPFGKVTAMLISIGEKFINNAYIWFKADNSVLKQASICYWKDGEIKKVVKNGFPYEFTIPVEISEDFEFWIEVINSDSVKQITDKIKIKA